MSIGDQAPTSMLRLAPVQAQATSSPAYTTVSSDSSDYDVQFVQTVQRGSRGSNRWNNRWQRGRAGRGRPYQSYPRSNNTQTRSNYKTRPRSHFNRNYCQNHNRYMFDTINCQSPCRFYEDYPPQNQPSENWRPGTIMLPLLSCIFTLTLSCRINNKKFLIDTGAEVSVVPVGHNPPHPCDRVLMAANRTTIRTYGSRNLTIMIGNKRFTWKFIVADVPNAILGADFLRHNGFLVDLKRGKLWHPDSSSFSDLSRGRAPLLQLDSIQNTSDTWGKLLAEFPSITSTEFKLTPAHATKHHIVTVGPPVASRPRRLSPENLALAKSAFDELLKVRHCAPFKISISIAACTCR